MPLPATLPDPAPPQPPRGSLTIALLAALTVAVLLWHFTRPAGPVASTALVLDGKATAVSVVGHLGVLGDRDNALDFDAIRAATAAGQFQPIGGNFNAGFDREGSWWIHFTVQTRETGDGDWLLVMDAPYVDRIEAWLPQLQDDGSTRVVRRHTGNRQPLASRDLPVRSFVLKLALPSTTPTDVWLRVGGTKTLNLAATLWREPAYARHVTLETAWLIVLIGAAALMTIIALIAGWWLRDRLFLWYASYVGASCLLFFANDGFIPVFVLPEAPVAASLIGAASVCLAAATGAQMVVALFDMRRRFRAIGNVLDAVSLFAVVSLVFVAADRYQWVAPWLNLSALVSTVIVIAISLQLIWRREPLSVLYFFGFTLHCSAVGAQLLRNLGVLPSNFFTQNGYQILAIAHMVSLAAALTLRLHRTEHERRRLQAQQLRSARDMERVLERRVAERTEALELEASEREMAQKQLVQALREQRHLIGMVSHEFRTPLGIIGASTEMVRIGLDDSDDAHRELAKIRRAIQRLTGLIETCLADDRIDSDALGVHNEAFDMLALLQMLASEHAQTRNRDVIVECADAEVIVDGDPALLSIAFNNLIDNAIKYSPAGTPVMVRIATGAAGTRVSVEDRGAGVARDERELVFERYYRSPRATRQPGAGMGLHVVRSLIQRHHGRLILAEPVGQGVGAVFVVDLPSAKVAA